MANTTIPSELIQADVALGGSPTTTTQSAGNNTTKLATTAFVTTAVNNLIASAPGTMDTLNEIAAALNDDPDFTTTVNNAIATKLPLSGGTMTGNIAHAGSLTIDVGGKILLSADNAGQIELYDGTLHYGLLAEDNSNFIIRSIVDNEDILFQGYDATNLITALTLDMSDAGTAIFNNNLVIPASIYHTGDTNTFFGFQSADTFTVNTAGSERMRIDSSGTLLVGTTDGSGAGLEISKIHGVRSTVTNNVAALFDRLSSDGDIALFRKDGTTVGSIGANSSDIYIASTGTYSCGLMFEGSSGASDIRPCNSSGALVDDQIDLGDTTTRFHNLYLSDTAKVGKVDIEASIGCVLDFSSTYSYVNNRDYRFITNNFGTGNWGGFSLERSTAAQGSPSEAMFGITLAGLVGIGVGGASGGGQPAAKLHIKQSANKSEGDSHFRIEGAGYSGFHWLNGTAYYIGQNSNGRQLRMYSGSNEGVGVYLTNGGNSWASYSDERLKENIQDIGSVTEKIKDIRCVTYNRKDVDDENKHDTIGFIAQDFVGKFDQVLDESKVLDTDEETRYSIRYTETIPILMKAIQEQQTQIETLKQEIREIKESG